MGVCRLLVASRRTSLPPDPRMSRHVQTPPLSGPPGAWKAQGPGSRRSWRLPTLVFLPQELYAGAGRRPSAPWKPLWAPPPPQAPRAALTGGSAWQNPGSEQPWLRGWRRWSLPLGQHRLEHDQVPQKREGKAWAGGQEGQHPNWTGTFYPEARALGCAAHGLTLLSHLRCKRLRGRLCQDRSCSTLVLRAGRLQQPGKAAGETGCGQAFTPRPRGKEGRRPSAAFFPSAFEIHKYFTSAVGGGRKGRICEAAHPSSDPGTVAGERPPPLSLSLSLLGSCGCRRRGGETLLGVLKSARCTFQLFPVPPQPGKEKGAGQQTLGDS